MVAHTIILRRARFNTMGWDGILKVQRQADLGRWEGVGEIDILDLVVNRRSLAVALGSADLGESDLELVPYDFSFLVSDGSPDWDSQSGCLDWNRFLEVGDKEVDFPFREPIEMVERVQPRNPALAAILLEAEETLRIEISIAW